MTVIAYDGLALAADKQATSGDTRSTVTKIFRHDGHLLGVTGNLSIGMEMVEWFRAGAVAKDYPASNRDEHKGSSLVVVRPDGAVLKYESSPVPFEVEGGFCAFGCGDQSALVAMSLGCTAREAVEVVSRFSTGCGGGVDVLCLAS